jgi:predicted Zn-dependent peptidase
MPVAMDILSDLVLNPLFRDEDVEKEKGVVLEEIKMDADSPDYLVHEMFSASFWKGHALGRPILGIPNTVKSLNSQGIREYYDSVYTPDNLLVTAAGNLKHEKMVELASERFRDLKTRPLPLPAQAPATHASISLKSKKELEQVHLCMGVPCYPIAHEDRFNCYVLNTVLGGGMSSRLFQNIREKQGLAYSVFSELNPYTDTGCLAVYAGTSLETLRQVVDSVLREFRQLKEEAVPAEELRRAKDHLKGSLMLGLESTSSRMSNLARQQMHFGRFFSLDELVESIEKVTAEHVQRIAREFFNPDLLAISVLGNLGKWKITRDDLVC